MSRLLTDDEITTQLEQLSDWKRADADGDAAITATYQFTDFVASIDFVNRVAHNAEQMQHHPDIDIRWDTVTLVLSTHSEGGLTQLDIELAHRIALESGSVG